MDLTKIGRLQNILKKQELDAALVASTANLFYFTGTVPAGYLYIPAEGNPKLFLRRPCEGCRGMEIRKPEQIPEKLEELGERSPKSILLEEEGVSAGEYFRLAKVFETAVPKRGSMELRKLRAVKTDEEIEILRRTAQVHARMYRKIPEFFRPGMTDVEFSIELERCARRLGHLGIFRLFGAKMEAFMGSVLVGENAENISPYDFALGGAGQHPSLPFGPNGTKIEGDKTVLVDMSCNTEGYITDMSRTYCVGSLPEKIKRAHEVSLEIQHELSCAAGPGITGAQLYDIAWKLVEKNRLQEHFMGTRQQAKFVGHGIGIEVNELPVLAPRGNMPLEENMVIALEPKFVFPYFGAVGTENTFLVKRMGLEQLTAYEEHIMRLECV